MAEINELAKAMNEFQAEIVTVGKNATNPFFKNRYADLANVMKEAQPILTKHGLSVIQLPDNLEGAPALTTIVLHTSGQSVQATVPLVLAKQDPQGLGAAITYERRYAYAAALQIVIDEDDDGNRASRQQAAPKTVQKVFPGAEVQGEPITEIQKRQFKSALTAMQIPEDEWAGYMVKNFNKPASQMSKAEAAKALKELM
jgi:hypothetical protein